jgi:sec-independent protein translocase protein TatA
MSETILAIGPLGTTEMLLIGAVIILLFGASKLPQLAKALGQSKKAFREGLDEGEREARKEAQENKTSTT